jgi:hypothetical protein
MKAERLNGYQLDHQTTFQGIYHENKIKIILSGKKQSQMTGPDFVQMLL